MVVCCADGYPFHRKQRRKATFKSALDEVPGIGPKKRWALLDHFGDQGDRTEVLQQYDVFSSGVKSLKALYPAPPADD